MSLVIDPSVDSSLESFLASESQEAFLNKYDAENSTRESQVKEVAAGINEFFEALNYHPQMNPWTPDKNVELFVMALGMKQEIAMQKVFKAYVTSNETVAPSLKDRLIEVLDTRAAIIEKQVALFNQLTGKLNIPLAINLEEASLTGALLDPESFEKSLRSYEDKTDESKAQYEEVTQEAEEIIKDINNGQLNPLQKPLVALSFVPYMKAVETEIENLKIFKKVVSRDTDVSQSLKERLVVSLDRRSEELTKLKTIFDRIAMSIN